MYAIPIVIKHQRLIGGMVGVAWWVWRSRVENSVSQAPYMGQLESIGGTGGQHIGCVRECNTTCALSHHYQQGTFSSKIVLYL